MISSSGGMTHLTHAHLHPTEAREISTVIAFLLSDEAAMVHGVMLPIDGGFLAV